MLPSSAAPVVLAIAAASLSAATFTPPLAFDTSLRCSSASVLPTPTYGHFSGVFTICAEQEIHGTLSDVYNAIIDFRAYSTWNSFVINVEVPDDVITAEDVYVGMPMKFTSEGLIPGQAAESDELVTFLEEEPQDGRVFNAWRFDGGGVGELVMRAEHPNLLTDLGDGVVRYVSYETFYGPVALLPGLVLRQNLQTAFEQQGMDLKAYVEGGAA